MTSRTQRLWRWFSYVAVAAAALANFNTFWHVDGWFRWINFAIGCLMVWAGYRLYANTRQLNRWWREWRWDLAAATPDPIRSMATMEYLDGLEPRQVVEIREYLDRFDRFDEIDLDDAPPVVRDFLLFNSAMRREQ